MKRSTLVLILVFGGLAVVVAGGLVAAVFVAALQDEGEGGLGSPALGYITIEGTISDSRETVRDIRQLSRNSAVRGLLVRVDSPGGVVTPAHEIYTELKRVRESGKPVVVSMGTVAASGGYYVSAPADMIVANPGTLTGSIGVIMELPILRGLLDKLGMRVEVVKSREHKDIGSPFRDMTPGDRALLQGVVADVYEQFVAVVSQEREIPLDSVRRFADGRILTGRQALALGLVDTLGTLEDAKLIAAEICGIKGEPRLVKPAPKLNVWLRRLMDGMSEKLLGVPQIPRLSYRW